MHYLHYVRSIKTISALSFSTACVASLSNTQSRSGCECVYPNAIRKAEEKQQWFYRMKCMRCSCGWLQPNCNRFGWCARGEKWMRVLPMEMPNICFEYCNAMLIHTGLKLDIVTHLTFVVIVVFFWCGLSDTFHIFRHSHHNIYRIASVVHILNLDFHFVLSSPAAWYFSNPLDLF